MLNLDGNNLGDSIITNFLEDITKFNKLKILNLSRNRITNASCKAIRELLVENLELLEFYL
jgi:hypothetical protein